MLLFYFPSLFNMTNLAVQVLLNNMVVVNHHLTSQYHYKINNCQVQENRRGCSTCPSTRRSVNWVFNQLGRKLLRWAYRITIESFLRRIVRVNQHKIKFSKRRFLKNNVLESPTSSFVVGVFEKSQHKYSHLMGYEGMIIRCFKDPFGQGLINHKITQKYSFTEQMSLLKLS